MTPNKIKGKEFEKYILERGKRLDKYKTWRFARYGTEAVFNGEGYRAIKSKPDFEFTLPPSGRHGSIEAKVISTSSFPIGSESNFKENQARHLIKEYFAGGIPILLLHFNQRVLVRKTEDPITLALPYHPELHEAYRAKVIKSLTKAEAIESYGAYEVQWNLWSNKCKRPEPDIASMIETYEQRYNNSGVNP